MDKVKDNVVYMDESFLNIRAEDSALEAAKKMRENKLDALLVVKGGERIGIVTETDLSRKIVAEELNPKETKVKFIMTNPIVSIDSESSMIEAFVKMGAQGIRNIAVTEEGLTMGILSIKNFV
jgi:signal-transduction protein with cAMP-binding, CBS, and nucleotidyltransferase domain